MSHHLILNCCWITLQVSHHQYWTTCVEDGNTNFSRRLKQFDDLTWLTSSVRILSKIARFSHPMYFAPSLKGFPLELSTGARSQIKLEWRGYRAEKEVWRYLQPSEYNTPTWQTDIERRQQRPRLRIASRGKKNFQFALGDVGWIISNLFCVIYFV